VKTKKKKQIVPADRRADKVNPWKSEGSRGIQELKAPRTFEKREPVLEGGTDKTCDALDDRNQVTGKVAK